MSKDSPQSTNVPVPSIVNIEIISLLGSGGMSLVYKARQIEMDRIVAVKVLSGLSVNDEKALKRFQNEAKLSSLLDHPNIAKTMLFGISTDGQPYIVMEYVAGLTLAEELKTNGRLQLQRFRDIFIPALSALADAHKAGLVHRDIKPGNIMLSHTDTGAYTVKIVDFGIAKLYTAADNQVQHLTKTGAVIGSPSYMSPEQCLGKELDWRSDIYSISCVMYEALCGEPPFTDDSSLAIMNKHANQPPPAVSELIAKIDLKKELASVLVSGLAKDPAARPQSAEELSGSLSEVLATIDLECLPRLKQIQANRRFMILSLTLVPVLIIAGWCLLTQLEKYVQMTSSEQKAAHTQKITPESIISTGEELEAGNNPALALQYYEKAIDQLLSKTRDRTRRQLLCEAYLHAGKAVLQTDKPVGRLPDKEHSASAEDQFIWYARKSMSIAAQAQDEVLFVLACKRMVDFLQKPDNLDKNVQEIIEEADRVCGRGSANSLEIRNYCNSHFIKYGSTETWYTPAKHAESRILETIDLASHETYAGLWARANLAFLYAQQKKFRKCDALVEEIAGKLIDSPEASSDTGHRVTILANILFAALVSSKNPALLKKLLERELQINGTQDEKIPWLIASMYEHLGLSYNAVGKPADSIEAKKQAVLYYLKDRDTKLNHPRADSCIKEILEGYRSLGQPEKALEYEKAIKTVMH